MQKKFFVKVYWFWHGFKGFYLNKKKKKIEIFLVTRRLKFDSSFWFLRKNKTRDKSGFVIIFVRIVVLITGVKASLKLLENVFYTMFFHWSLELQSRL